MTDVPQVWELTVGGRHHRVESRTGALQKTVRWLVDGDLVAERRTAEDKVRLTPEVVDGAEPDPSLGEVLVHHSGLGSPRRATLLTLDPDDEAAAAKQLAGLGGVDLVPAAGSKAAAYEERLRRHPRRHAALQAAGAVAGVLVPLLLTALAARFAFSVDLPDIPWPNLPDIPWPNLPDIPWPNLPDLPWPDWALPGWVARLLDYAGYLWPVVLAVVIARAEIGRRRKQDQLRTSWGGDGGPGHRPATTRDEDEGGPG